MLSLWRRYYFGDKDGIQLTVSTCTKNWDFSCREKVWWLLYYFIFLSLLHEDVRLETYCPLSHFVDFLLCHLWLPKWIWEWLTEVKVQTVDIEGNEANELTHADIERKAFALFLLCSSLVPHLAGFQGWHSRWLLPFSPIQPFPVDLLLDLKYQLIWSLLSPPFIKIK